MDKKKDYSWARKFVEETTPIKELYKGVKVTHDENGREYITAPSDTHVLRSKAQIDSYKKRQVAEKGRDREFTFTHMDNISEVIERVSDKHCGYLLFLQCYVNYDAILENPNKTAMSKSDIKRTLKLKDTAFKEFIGDMVKHEIIFVDKTEDSERYRLNPRYHFQGKSDNRNVIKSFTTKVKELYTEVNAKDLGFIYKLLPFVHFETNTICVNPYEKDVEYTVPLNKADIATIAGMTEKSVYSKMRNLKLGNEYVFAEVIHGKYRFYKVNPFVFYRKNGKPDPTLREMFSLRNNFAKRK